MRWGLLVVLVGCGGAAREHATLVGVWTAGEAHLPVAVIRADANAPSRPRVVSRAWSFAEDDAGRTLWCRQDLRDGRPSSVLQTPCVCAADDRVDCATGVVRIDDAVVFGTVTEITLSHDDARSDLVGVLQLLPGDDAHRLGVHVLPVTADPLRRPTAATGLPGPTWARADGLGWYRQTR